MGLSGGLPGRLSLRSSRGWRGRDPGRRRRVAGVLAACLLSAALGMAVGAIGQPRVIPSRVRLSVAPDDSPDRATSSAATTPSAGVESAPRDEPAAPVEDPSLLTGGVSVQVLNATAARRADNRMAARLRRLGYSVAALNPAVSRYRATTVFWSERSGKAAALALARRFDWAAARRPRNLSRSVTIHVVVGRDEVR